MKIGSQKDTYDVPRFILGVQQDEVGICKSHVGDVDSDRL